MRKRAPRRRQELPEGIKIQGGTGAGEEEARWRRAVNQDWRHDPPWDWKGPFPRLRPAGGWGGVFENWRRKYVTKTGEPTGVDRRASNVEGSERGGTGQGTRRQKRYLGAGLQGLTGNSGAGQGWQDSKFRTGGGGRWDGSFFGQDLVMALRLREVIKPFPYITK